MPQRDIIDRAASYASASVAKQPAPIANENPAIADLIIAELNSDLETDRKIIAALKERDRVGRQTYGISLQAHNGRDPKIDLWQEALDGLQYARQWMEEAKGTREFRDAELAYEGFKTMASHLERWVD